MRSDDRQSTRIPALKKIVVVNSHHGCGQGHAAAILDQFQFFSDFFFFFSQGFIDLFRSIQTSFGDHDLLLSLLICLRGT